MANTPQKKCRICGNEIFYSTFLDMPVHRCPIGDQYYILNSAHQTFPVDIDTYQEWESLGGGRTVGETSVGNYRVVTTFLGLDQNNASFGKPLLFESRIEGATTGLIRYATWSNAVYGHEQRVQEARQLNNTARRRARREEKKALEALAKEAKQVKKTYTDKERSITFDD